MPPTEIRGDVVVNGTATVRGGMIMPDGTKLDERLEEVETRTRSDRLDSIESRLTALENRA